MTPPRPSSPYERTALGRLAAFAFRRRGLVLLAWVAAAIGAFALGSAAAGDFSADYSTPGSESKAAATVLEERFDGRSQYSVDLVWSAGDVRDPAVERSADAMLQRAAAWRASAGAPPRARPRSRPTARPRSRGCRWTARPDDVPESTGESLVALADHPPAGLHAAVGGEFDPGAEEPPAASSELIGIAAAAIVLLLTFGTVVAAGLPLITALFGLGDLRRRWSACSPRSSTCPTGRPASRVMIGLGVGIDYALLIVTRYRSGAGRRARAARRGGRGDGDRRALGPRRRHDRRHLAARAVPHGPAVPATASRSPRSLTVLVVHGCAAVTLLPALLGFAGPA